MPAKISHFLNDVCKSTQSINCSGINLMKDMAIPEHRKELTLLRKIKDDSNIWRGTLRSWIGILSGENDNSI